MLKLIGLVFLFLFVGGCSSIQASLSCGRSYAESMHVIHGEIKKVFLNYYDGDYYSLYLSGDDTEFHEPYNTGKYWSFMFNPLDPEWLHGNLIVRVNKRTLKADGPYNTHNISSTKKKEAIKYSPNCSVISKKENHYIDCVKNNF